MSAESVAIQALTAFRRNVERVDRVADRIARDASEGDLAASMIELRRAEAETASAARALQTADEMVGTLLDVFA